MTFILNEFEIETAQIKAAHDFHRPNVQAAVLTLARLMEWTNDNSDGWAYWSRPLIASKKLQGAVHDFVFHPFGSIDTSRDLTSAELKTFYTPIKAFLTRQKVDHSLIFPNG